MALALKASGGRGAEVWRHVWALSELSHPPPVPQCVPLLLLLLLLLKMHAFTLLASCDQVVVHGSEYRAGQPLTWAFRGTMGLGGLSRVSSHLWWISGFSGLGEANGHQLRAPRERAWSKTPTPTLGPLFDWVHVGRWRRSKHTPQHTHCLAAAAHTLDWLGVGEGLGAPSWTQTSTTPTATSQIRWGWGG